MNTVLLIYTFLLFVLLTPSFLFKTNVSIMRNIIYACIFTIIYNCSYYLVKGTKKEGMDVNVTIVGASKLENILNAIFPEEEEEQVKFLINNNFVSKFFSR